ncbi:MAG: hypothetical protein RRC34_10615 [Lentisphaeria bacterium]|nr:hypothetical protein [Lentisphaeria bacterium]
MTDSSSKINHLSPHLFWDVDANTLDWEKHAPFIIGRVLDLGTLADWHLLKQHYGIDRIAETATRLRSLNQRTAAFVATVAHIPREKFACYTTKPLTSRHWPS